MTKSLSTHKTTPTISTQPQQYLTRALNVLEHIGISIDKSSLTQMETLLADVATIDQARTVQIARVLGYQELFNQLVRDNTEENSISDRYGKITRLFDSVRDDSRRAVEQLADGKISIGESLENLLMRLTRGSVKKRFEKIADTYNGVSNDTADQIKREKAIQEAYADFRIAFKEGVALTQELAGIQADYVQNAQTRLDEVTEKLKGNEVDGPTRTRLESDRDIAMRALKGEQRKHQFLSTLADDMNVGYQASEAVLTRLAQQTEMKEALYRRGVTFFTTNSTVFTALGASIVAQRSNHEQAKTIDAMVDGTNRAIEDLAATGASDTRMRATAYGPGVNAESVKKLVDAIVQYQQENEADIIKYGTLSRENSQAITGIVEDGKQRLLAAMRTYRAE